MGDILELEERVTINFDEPLNEEGFSNLCSYLAVNLSTEVYQTGSRERSYRKLEGLSRDETEWDKVEIYLSSKARRITFKPFGTKLSRDGYVGMIAGETIPGYTFQQLMTLPDKKEQIEFIDQVRESVKAYFQQREQDDAFYGVKPSK